MIRAILTVMFACWVSYAFAQQTSIDMTTVLTDENNQPMKDEVLRGDAKDCGKCPPLTLGAAVAHALFIVMADEAGVTPEQKWAWAVFAEKIRNDRAAKLTAPEADLICRRLGKLYSGVVLMRAYPLIDPNRQPPEIK